MAESVDALVSNTSGFTSIPVRPRVWVRNKEAGKVLMLFPLSFYTYLLCPLLMGTDIWQEIEVLNQEFVRLGISQSVDYEKYYLYSLITHSTAIEGSTLTELDTQLLFDEGITAKGKPLVYHLMNEDLKKAYELAKEESAQNAEITPVFLQKLNAALMRTTGSVYNVMGGSFDSSKGEFRLCGVTLVPLVAFPLFLPFCCFLYFVLFGINGITLLLLPRFS